VHVDEARQERALAEVEPAGIGRHDISLAADAHDAAVGNDDLGVLDLAAGEHVDHARSGHHERVRMRDGREAERAECGGGEGGGTHRIS